MSVYIPLRSAGRSVSARRTGRSGGRVERRGEGKVKELTWLNLLEAYMHLEAKQFVDEQTAVIT